MLISKTNNFKKDGIGMSFAFVFPGQGSQSLKMMDGLLGFEIIKQTFLKAEEILGINYLKMLQEDNSQNINQTINTQPLMLTAGFAVYQLWLELHGRKPVQLAGHSLGEWTALVASNVINFEDALRLVKLRATLMQQAVPEGNGAMVAVLGLEDSIIIEACREVVNRGLGVVAGVNFNSPGQVVIAGNKNAVSVASDLLKERGAKRVQLLPLSVPSHCSLMLSASEKLAKELTKIHFNKPEIPVIHNYNVEIYSNTNLIKDALIKQLYSPVLWTSVIRKIVDGGINQIVECGPGKVLSSLNKRIKDNIISYNLNTEEDFNKALSELN